MGNVSLNGNGVSKGYQLPFATETQELLSRMDALGELPNVTQQKNINFTIKELINNCLFSNRFDALYVMRGYGEAATKLNWIKNAHNLTKGGAGTLTFQEGIGYNNDGVSSYLDTNYTPSTEAINYKLLDASVGIKLSGTLNDSLNGYMGSDGDRDTGFVSNSGNGLNGINGSFTVSGSPVQVGYNCITRVKKDEGNEYINETKYTNVIGGGDASPQYSIHILSINSSTGAKWFAPSSAIAEFAFIGGYLTQTDFNTLRTIINNYISRL